jgi:hypothetical protein
MTCTLYMPMKIAERQFQAMGVKAMPAWRNAPDAVVWNHYVALARHTGDGT